jgi:hypothetical protein
VFNLSDVYSVDYMLWYTREASVAVYVANLPLIWPLLREWIPLLRNTTKDNSYQLPTYENRKKQGGQGSVTLPSQGYSKHTGTDTSVSLNDVLSSGTLQDSKTPEIISIETTKDKSAGQSVSSPTGSSFASNSPSTEKAPEPNFSTPTRTSHIPRKSTDSRVATAISTTRSSNEFVKEVENVREGKRNSGILTHEQRSSGWGQYGKIKTSTTIEVSSNASQVNGLGNEDFSAGKPMGFEIDRALSLNGAREVKIVGPEQISHW